MAKFKVGDIVVANELSNGCYYHTCKNKNYEGEVTDVFPNGGIILDSKFEVEEKYFDLKSLILDSTEFNYLWNIIKPFKDGVEYIRKTSYGYCYYILVVLKNSYWCALPHFNKKSSMYKGMEANKKYTLEELGFVEPKSKRLNCKAVCIESNNSWLTVGKIYEFKDGHITFDNGHESNEYESVEDFNIKTNRGWELLEILEDK